MKDLSTAKTELRTRADGRLYLHIRHQVLHGVTPRMLVWWFSNLEGEIVVAGKEWPRYQIWHPVDHISIRYARRRPDGNIGPGAKIQIREALGGRLDYLVDIVTTIEKLDETGFIHVIRPRVFPDERAPAWLKHNVEEVGNFEYFLPDLYASQVTERAVTTPPVPR